MCLNVTLPVTFPFFFLAGANILIYTFPILSIAILSCLYLHIRKKMADNNTERYLVYHCLYSYTLSCTHKKRIEH